MIEFKYIVYFLLTVNLLGFTVAGVNALLRKKTKYNVEILSVICSVLGGSVGVLVGFILFDRKADKENMTSRVIVICTFVIQSVLALFFALVPTETVTFDFIGFISANIWLAVYWAVICLVTFILFGIDKYNAVKDRDRISIVTLLLFSFLGGAVGGLLAMYIFRHKTRKSYFTVGLPLMILTHAVLLFFIMNIF